MQWHQIVWRAKKNGGVIRHPRKVVSISVDQVVDMLDNCAQKRSHALRLAARRVVHHMAQGPWLVMAGPKRGGVGNAEGPDNEMHITVRPRKSRHLHIRLDKRGHPYMISRHDGKSLVDVVSIHDDCRRDG